jgi:hypothetical protein
MTMMTMGMKMMNTSSGTVMKMQRAMKMPMGIMSTLQRVRAGGLGGWRRPLPSCCARRQFYLCPTTEAGTGSASGVGAGISAQGLTRDLPEGRRKSIFGAIPATTQGATEQITLEHTGKSPAVEDTEAAGYASARGHAPHYDHHTHTPTPHPDPAPHRTHHPGQGYLGMHLQGQDRDPTHPQETSTPILPRTPRKTPTRDHTCNKINTRNTDVHDIDPSTRIRPRLFRDPRTRLARARHTRSRTSINTRRSPLPHSRMGTLPRRCCASNLRCGVTSPILARRGCTRPLQGPTARTCRRPCRPSTRSRHWTSHAASRRIGTSLLPARLLITSHSRANSPLYGGGHGMASLP